MGATATAAQAEAAPAAAMTAAAAPAGAPPAPPASPQPPAPPPTTRQRSTEQGTHRVALTDQLIDRSLQLLLREGEARGLSAAHGQRVEEDGNLLL